MTRHYAKPYRQVNGGGWMCECGRERRLKAVRSRYGSQSPIRNEYWSPSWRASHGRVLDPDRWKAWQAKAARR